MANWKKVIVSGSDAHLKDVTASAGLNLPGIAAIKDGGQPNVTTPLVIDQYGNVSTGSKYALASGGDTVGASSALTDNFVIVGTGGQGIEIANANSDANFNGAQVYGIASITSSGDLIFSQSAAEIAANGPATIESANSNLVINANDINAATLDLTGNLTTNLTTTRVPFIGTSGVLEDDSTFTFTKGTDTLNVSKINSVDTTTVVASGDITGNTKVNAPAITGSTAISVGTGATNQIVAKGAANGLHIGNVNSKTIISASGLILSSSGGITASVVPTTIRPPFYLGRKASGEIVQVPLANVGGGGGSTSGISGIDSGDNINISGVNQVTTTTETLIAIKIAALNGVASITASNDKKDPQNSSILEALTGTDNIRIKYDDGTFQDIGVAAFDDSPNEDGALWGVSFDAVIANSPHEEASHELYKLVTSTVGIPTINVNENLVIAGSSSFGDTVTMSGDLIFSGSTAGLPHQITAYPLGGTGLGSIQELQITSSHILNHGNITTDTINFNSVQFIANQAIIISGSTQFGSGSGNTHQFTGSLLLSGSLVIDGSAGNTITLGSSTVDATEFGILDGATVSTAELNILDGVTATTSELNLLDGVTATTAELNILDGVTATTSELNIIDGVTATTSELNILDGVTSTTAELNILDGVTANSSELNILDGVTATTAELNILDGVTSTAAELNILDGVTSTAAELNILDGVTANSSELNILDGVTSTTAELNILDGVTATAAEINILDGVTANSSELNILDGVTSTTAELNILDGVTATAAEINILDGVTSTAAELNILDGATVTTDELNILDGVTVNASHINSTITSTGGTFTGNVEINSTNTLTVGGTATFNGDVNLGSGNDTVTINGDLIVEGTTQTINSTNLAIEDRFILIGSGSSTTDTGFGGNFDVGIIFENRQGPNNDGFGQGTALYHDASDDRLNVARNVPSNIGSNQIGHGASVEVGHVVTVRTTASLGTKLNTTLNQAGAGDDFQVGDVIFGEGEMVIDGNKDLWIYVASQPTP